MITKLVMQYAVRAVLGRGFYPYLIWTREGYNTKVPPRESLPKSHCGYEAKQPFTIAEAPSTIEKYFG